jgi:hypothetical protein
MGKHKKSQSGCSVRAVQSLVNYSIIHCKNDSAEFEVLLEAALVTISVHFAKGCLLIGYLIILSEVRLWSSLAYS